MSVRKLYDFAIDLATNPKRTRWVSTLVYIAEMFLGAFIIAKVPYTEIDWKTYMEQASVFTKGEMNYTKIEGPTGPCVYPALHVYIYSALHELTNAGKDVLTGQKIFGGLFLTTLFYVLRCYRTVQAPPYLFPLLILSKRLHSIFYLRLFNDCFAVLFLWMAIDSFQSRQWSKGSLLLTLGVGVKMTILVALPGALMVLGLALPTIEAIQNVGLIIGTQILIAFPFLLRNPQGYLSRAFEFSRQFLFKWTVNWRFVGEEMFLSKYFAGYLTFGHLVTLTLFAVTSWTPNVSVQLLVRRILSPLPPILEQHVNSKVTPKYVMTAILSSLVIGMLFARSLHYQFFAYVAWATPFLLWRAGVHPVTIYVIYFLQELGWNIFPSTDASSMVVVGMLAIQVVGVWVRTAITETISSEAEDTHEHEE